MDPAGLYAEFFITEYSVSAVQLAPGISRERYIYEKESKYEYDGASDVQTAADPDTLGGLLMPGGFMTKDPVLWPLFRQFLLGQAIGVLPLILGSQLSSFLSLVNQTKRATIASLIYIAVNVVLNYLFLQVMHLEAFGLE